MINFDEGLKLLEERFGNSKDNVLSLATIASELGAHGKPRPIVREVDAFYENGVF
jgi:hypothetical protein